MLFFHTKKLDSYAPKEPSTEIKRYPRTSQQLSRQITNIPSQDFLRNPIATPKWTGSYSILLFLIFHDLYLSVCTLVVFHGLSFLEISTLSLLSIYRYVYYMSNQFHYKLTQQSLSLSLCLFYCNGIPNPTKPDPVPRFLAHHGAKAWWGRSNRRALQWVQFVSRW